MIGSRSTDAITTDVVLVGAGHAHVIALRSFAMRPIPGVRITLITRQVHTPYSGMLPGLISGHYEFDDVHIDTAPLTRLAGARLYQSEVIGIDTDNRRVLCENRPPVPYDVLSIDIGSTPGGASIPGVGEHAIPVKPIDSFLISFDAALERIVKNNGKARVGIVGGGAAGVELALALDTRLRADVAAAGGDASALSFTLLAGGSTILPSLASGLRSRLERIMGERGIRVVTDARVTQIDRPLVQLEGGQPVALDEVFWATQAAAAPWLAASGLSLDPHGFIAVDDTLRSISHEGVFAAGDCASMIGRTLPKSGVYAVRQGRYLADNIRRTVQGKALRYYRPQRDALYLVSTGGRHAVGTRNGVSFEGGWAWRWKDRIDRAFMRQFSELPAMDPAGELSAMRCGGCGGKVSAPVLSQALGDVVPVERPEVVVGLHARDDAAVVDTGGARYSVHTVDYFRTMIDDPYLFGRIAANHALGDIYAMGAEPLTALAIATLPHGPTAKTQVLLADLMSGANEILADAGCALVGGHTSEGAELALGFSVNGAVARRELLRKSGCVPGTVLILTKAIGTGTLFAAHMRGRAKARWVMNALDHMGSPSRKAAEILRAHNALAMTDVTGFGLVGHLAQMLEASGAGARIEIDRIAVLDGAIETAAAGELSSLHADNALMRQVIANAGQVERHPKFQLLFDPQTAGGLLCALPKADADRAVDALHAAGYHDAAMIGRVVERLRDQARIVIEAAVRPD